MNVFVLWLATFLICCLFYCCTHIALRCKRSAGRPALVTVHEQRDWLALPTGVLQHIVCLSSTWQTPGPCLASLVCRTWRHAAAGCSGIRLLFHAGYAPADQALSAWLAGNGQRLDALTLGSISQDAAESVLEALAGAAAAAQAAGQPLPLHTLRVPRWRLQVTPHTVGRLLAALPNLRCLQLALIEPVMSEGADNMLEDLAPLQQAMQLQELYLTGPLPNFRSTNYLGGLLPLSLRRLSWEPAGCLWFSTLSHLTQLSFLALGGVPYPGIHLRSQQLPSSLQQLELWDSLVGLDVVEEQRQALTGWRINGVRPGTEQWQLLARLPNLRAAEASSSDLSHHDGRTSVQQLANLSALTLWALESEGDRGWSWGIPQALATAASLSNLRCLHLGLDGVPQPSGLCALTQVTQLRVAVYGGRGSATQLKAWGEAVGRLTGLQWMSVPSVLLCAPGRAWLGGLQQLRVLVLQCSGRKDVAQVSSMSWVGTLPPQLQVLSVGNVPGAIGGFTAEQAAALQLRRRLQQALGSSGCEVVVGVDLDEAADPTQQLAGVPEALQQALA